MATPQYDTDHDDSQPQGLTTRVSLPRVALALAELVYCLLYTSPSPRD